MRLKQILSWASLLMSVPSDNARLLQAQCASLSRLIPLMYFILLANSWVLAASYVDTAPLWLAIYCPIALTIICAIRIAIWWRRRNATQTTEAALRSLTRTNIVAGIVSACFSGWAIAFYPYGDALARSHIAFYLTISVVGCIFCLMHLRSAALIVTAVVNTAFVSFFVATGEPTFIAMAINVVLVTVAILIAVLIQNHDFTRMIIAQTEAERRQQEQSRLLRMIDDMPVAVMTIDAANFTINYLNETSKRTLSRIEGLLPIKASDLLGASIDVFHSHPEHQRRLLTNPNNLPHHARINLGPEILDLQISPVNAEDGSYIGPMLSWSIVTQQVEAENRIRQLAHYDTLTGLPNRTTFRDELEASLAKPSKPAGLLFIDLDGFKIINDSKGHLVGDKLLRQVADRLRGECGEPGTTISRLGGDEFAILLRNGDPEQVSAIASTLINALLAPYHLDRGRQVRIGASIGVALAPQHGEDAETLLSRADMALYGAKAAGKGTFRLFSPDMEASIQERVSLEAELRIALEEHRGLFVFYQSISNIETGQVTAREALARWHHPQRGWISPGEFIPVAEDSGLIDQLGQFVLSRACRDASTWDDGARVAVNVSAGQLGKGTLAAAILGTLADTGLAPDRLEIEITETALLNNEPECIADLRQVRGMGVRVALDDFGTGYSSLANLRAFPFDKIKIDGSFVKDAVTRSDCAAVVKVVADLGKRLGVITVAEGVETPEQLERVAKEGCSEVQGHLIGLPMPSDQDAPIVARLELNRATRKASAAWQATSVGAPISSGG